jgi:Co/Zn/Cd efflux system component
MSKAKSGGPRRTCGGFDGWRNIAVLLAALGVFGTGTLWPDVIVAVLMATLALQGSVQWCGNHWAN